jgi:hypothetical protein
MIENRDDEGNITSVVINFIVVRSPRVINLPTEVVLTPQPKERILMACVKYEHRPKYLLSAC